MCRFCKGGVFFGYFSVVFRVFFCGTYLTNSQTDAGMNLLVVSSPMEGFSFYFFIANT